MGQGILHGTLHGMLHAMRVESTIAGVREARRALAPARQRVAFVPTMGALHDGHLTLIDEARHRADIVVASIFVNPLQFGPREDFSKYPRTLDQDVALLREHGTALVFTPEPAEMYPDDRVTSVTATPHDAMFEGAERPGHFTGVLTAVAKLFNIVQPDVALFGQKDLQQLSFVRRMVRDLDMPLEIVGIPTVREPDGLAMSSRNRYLGSEDRARASRLYATLTAMRDAYGAGIRDSTALIDTGLAILAQDSHISVDYLAVIDPDSFLRVTTARQGAAIIVAARVGGTRLLDNIIL